MADPYRNAERIEDGREATLVRGVVEPWINGYIDDKVTLMVAIYRSGSYTHDDLVGKVAEISALRSLIDSLQSTERRGSIAMEKENAKA
jgi:hypothetical protein